MNNQRLSWAFATFFAFGLAACDVTQTEEGKMPEVDVDVKEGNLPKYDVDSGDIDIEKKEVTVPTLDYDSPKEDEREEAMGLDGQPEPEPQQAPQN